MLLPPVVELQIRGSVEHQRPKAANHERSNPVAEYCRIHKFAGSLKPRLRLRQRTQKSASNLALKIPMSHGGVGQDPLSGVMVVYLALSRSAVLIKEGMTLNVGTLGYRDKMRFGYLWSLQDFLGLGYEYWMKRLWKENGDHDTTCCCTYQHGTAALSHE